MSLAVPRVSEVSSGHSINQSRIARRVSVGSKDGRILPHDPSTEITRLKYAHPSDIPTVTYRGRKPPGVSSARVESQRGIARPGWRERGMVGGGGRGEGTPWPRLWDFLRGK